MKFDMKLTLFSVLCLKSQTLYFSKNCVSDAVVMVGVMHVRSNTLFLYYKIQYGACSKNAAYDYIFKL